ncbi:MAG: polysaccharide deacetylase family protein [Lachnospiraceae bacterium]|nr:polysaccharide deacetylase family protein [Lachnospiraceae bacterium]
MLVVFFLLTLAFGTVGVVLALRLESLQKEVAELEGQLASERAKLEQYIIEDAPIGAGGKEEDAQPSTDGGNGTVSGEGQGSEGTQGTGPEPTSAPEETADGRTTTEASSSEEVPTEPTPTQAASQDKTTEAATEAGSTQEENDADEEGEWADKKIYLTFDDGPSKYTDDILEILAEYDAKATFFVIGKTDEHSKEMYQRIVDEGHTLAIHSYTHKYKEIYASVDAFAADFTKLSDLLYEVTGVRPGISRFPGGSSNKQSKIGIEPFVKYLNEEGIIYFDWNVENGDATGKTYTAEELAQNALDGIANFKRPVVLMHDTDAKKATVDSLPEILETIQKKGGRMLALDESVTPVQHVKANSFDESKE